MAEEDRLLYLISRAVTKLKYYSIEKFRSNGITVTPSQMGILFALGMQNGLTMSELSSLTDVDNSTLTRLADRLEKQGYVERKKTHTDRRTLVLNLTDSGLRESEKAASIAHEINDEIKSGFTDEEIRIFVRVLDAFNEKFRLEK